MSILCPTRGCLEFTPLRLRGWVGPSPYPNCLEFKQNAVGDGVEGMENDSGGEGEEEI